MTDVIHAEQARDLRQLSLRVSRRAKITAGGLSTVILLLIPKCIGCIGVYLGMASGAAWGTKEFCRRPLSENNFWPSSLNVLEAAFAIKFLCLLLAVSCVAGLFFLTRRKKVSQEIRIVTDKTEIYPSPHKYRKRAVSSE